MRLTSAINSLSKSDGNLPVSIFCYKGQKRFLRVSESYEETIERVVNSFRIQRGQTVLLQTSSFTACKGRSVVIDSSAYPLLWSILEEIEVVVNTEHALEKDEEPAPKGKAHDSEVIEQQFIMPSSPIAGPSRDGLGGTTSSQTLDARPTPSPSIPSEAELPKEDEMPPITAQALPKSDPLLQWDDDIQQDTKQAERVEETPATPPPERKFKAVPGTGRSESRSAINGLWSPIMDVGPIVKKEKQKGTDASASAKLGSPAGLENPTKKAFRSANDEDARFDVVIIGPDEDPTQFKLRGRNSVRKVLVAACKNFAVDPNRACLIHAMELEVDGELQTHDFVCSPDDTIAMCGIKAGSKLFIKVDPAAEDVDYDSE